VAGTPRRLPGRRRLPVAPLAGPAPEPDEPVAHSAPDTAGGSGGEPLVPWVEAGSPTTLPWPTAVGLPEVTGFTVNTRIHPHGQPTRWFVEYGPGFGRSTEPRALPGRLTAHYAEDWSAGASGWNSGFLGALTAEPVGGPDGGPFVRSTDEGSYGNDANHYDGIGLIHLGPYVYIGNYYWAGVAPLYLGGGFPDLRGARVSVWLRGVGWDGKGTELGSWIQAYRDPTVVEVLPEDSRYPNWAYTGDLLTPHLASGVWERAEWTLRNTTHEWTFAGSYGGRLLYDYGELDRALAGVNVDWFVWQVLYCDLFDLPSGVIDTADLQLTYRQRSLTAPSNGGALRAEPVGGTGADLLTDGWRFGPGREWRSAPQPTGPQVFEYSFERPVTVTSVNVMNSPSLPSTDVRVSLSEDGGRRWVVVAEGTLPTTHELGPNHLFLHADAWVLKDGVAVWAPLHPRPVDRLRVEVLAGASPERWGLGEIEAFGTGAAEATDDEWYDATADVLVPPGTWTYRVVAESDGEDGHRARTVGPAASVVVPAP
jgi:hypothetical protein